MNINKLKLRASFLRHLIDTKKKHKQHLLEEYARLIWLIDIYTRNQDLRNN